MPVVRSRYNGLYINVPADAAGVMGRFATAGGNELVFDQKSIKNGRSQRFDRENEEPVRIDSTETKPARKRSKPAADTNAEQMA